jgi:hypothetical protein
MAEFVPRLVVIRAYYREIVGLLLAERLSDTSRSAALIGCGSDALS